MINNILNNFTRFIHSLAESVKSFFNNFVAIENGAHFEYIISLAIFGISLALIVYILNKIFERKVYK